MSVNITYREDRARYQVDYFLDGKRRRPLFKERREAEAFARRLQLGLKEEDQSAALLSDLGKQYFSSVSSKKNHNSMVNDKRYINLHYHFMSYERGIERVNSVTLEDMEAFRDWLPLQTEFDDKPMKMGAGSVNRCLAVLKHMYKKAVQWKYRQDSPCLYLDFLDHEPKERRVMTISDYALMLEKAPLWLRPALAFMHLTGAPASCVERLEWEHVDFEQRAITIRRKKGAKARMKSITLPITDAVLSLLEALKPGDSGAVFKSAKGGPLRADRITRLGNRAIKAAGLKDVTLYGLRHGLASELTAHNVATEIIRQALGHQSIQTTQRYANKVSSNTVKSALELVRGGSMVTESSSCARMDQEGKVS